MLRLKRAYEPVDEADGYRVLVERLWPRGVTKQAARIDEWLKAVAPSDELRRWFGHEPSRWAAFRSRYERELRAGEAAPGVQSLARRARSGEDVTLVYGARDEEHNSAVVLRDEIERRLRRRRPPASRHAAR